MLSAAERKAAFKSFNQKRSSRTLTGSNTRLPVGSQKNLDVEAPAGSPKEAGALESDRSIQPDVDQGMVLPFEPVVMTFKDVHYWVNCPPVSLREMPNAPAQAQRLMHVAIGSTAFQ